MTTVFVERVVLFFEREYVKIMRMMYAVLVAQFLMVPSVWAKWEQANWLVGQNVALAGSDIWAFNKLERVRNDFKEFSPKETVSEYVLKKWNNQTKQWEQKATLKHSCRGNCLPQVVAAPDGSVFMFVRPSVLPLYELDQYKRYVTPEEYQILISDSKKGFINSVIQNLIVMDKGNLVKEFNDLSKKIGEEEAISKIFGKLSEDEFDSILLNQRTEKGKLKPSDQERQVTPLYRFFDGKIEKVCDMPSEWNGLFFVGATNKNELLVGHLVERNVIGSYLEKFDGTTFKRIAFFDARDHLQIGTDNVLYSVHQEKDNKLAISKLDGSNWKNFISIQTPFLCNLNTTGSIVIVNDHDIWIALTPYEKSRDVIRSSLSKTSFFHWNGKKLEVKINLDFNVVSAALQSTSDLFLIKEYWSGYGIWYQWVENKNEVPSKKK
jgi:hypothetical protein